MEKLVAAGITTVEAVADMTPEQLEEVPGIGPKTVEKISIAVNNYFSSLEAAEVAPEEAAAEGVAAEGAPATEGLAEEDATAAEEAAADEGLAAEEATQAEGCREATRTRCRRKPRWKVVATRARRVRIQPDNPATSKACPTRPRPPRTASRTWSNPGNTTRPKSSKASKMLLTPM